MLRSAVLSLLLTIAWAATYGHGSVLLVGGGGEDYNDWSDEPYRWLVQRASNKRIVILHYSDASTFLPPYFRWLGAAWDSNLVISSTAAANDSTVYRAILSADGVFLRGGDQWQYVNRWGSLSLTDRAIKEVYARGGVVGGTSAGLAVLTGVIFDARITSVDPRTALRNPLSSGISFTEGFLGLVPSSIGDSHFFERGRIGRLPAMMALYKRDSGREIIGIGVDYNTALAIDSTLTAEAMGAGTVTILRFAPTSSFTLSSGQPFSLKNMKLDQLGDGFRMNLGTGDVEQPGTAAPYMARPVTMQATRLLLDGSGNSTDWFGSAGSVQRFLSGVTNPGDSVAVVSSLSSPTSAQSVSSFLTQRGTAHRLVWASELQKNDASLSAALSRCGGFILVSANPDTVSRFLNEQTAVGASFRARIRQGVPVLILSNDVKATGDTTVTGTESHVYAAYYGYMGLEEGLGLVEGLTVMPRVYENRDYIDNRMSGLFWGLAKSRAAYGVALDAGTHLSIADGRLRAYGPTPVLVVDARSVTAIDFPSFRDPGKPNPRQNAAMIGAVIHAVREGEDFDLGSGTVVSAEGPALDLPGEVHLYVNYPNPFNPTTTIEYTIGGTGSQGPGVSEVHLVVYDMLGREVAVLVKERKAPGSHKVIFDGAALPSGAYLCRLHIGNRTLTTKLLLVK